MRDRLLVGVLVFLGVVLTLVYLMDGSRGPGGGAAVFDVALLMMNAIGALVALFLGTSLVHKELDKRTVYIVLAKPLSRLEFLVGKYLGLVATLGLMIALMGVFLAALMAATGDWRPQLFALLLGLWVELGIVTAMAFFFACITSAMLAALYAFCLFALGHQGTLIRAFADSEVKLSLVNYYFGHVMYVILPHFEIFDLRTQVLYGTGMPWAAWGAGLGYGALMIAMLLLLASVAWEAKELS